MTADEFVKIVRKGAEKLRVDKIVLDIGERKISGKGMLRISREEIELDMILDAEETPPPKRYGVFTKSDYWKLSGLIEDCLPFTCDYVSNGKESFFSGSGVRKVTLTFDLNPIDLVPTGWDAMTREERAHAWNEIHRQSGHPEQTSAQSQEEKGSVYFYAQVIDYSIPTQLCKGTNVITVNPYLGERPSGRLDTLMGEIEGYEFALIKDDNSEDVHVHLESKREFKSPSEELDWKKFYALMKALAFTLGVHAWPYRVQYWRDGRKIADRVTPTRRLAKTVHVPFRLENFNFQDVVKKATAFFELDSVLSEEVAEILFLFREAADYESVHGGVTVLATCVLFESLVNQLFKELKLAEKAPAEVPELESFEKAKTEIRSHIQGQVAAKGKGYERMLKVVGAAQPFTVRERFQAIASHFGLQWPEDMEVIFRTWQSARDPLVHGKRRANLTETELKDLMLAESRIAGGINILVLKLMGYSGRMSASAFEEKYREV